MSETPSFNQITEQHDSGKQATVLVKRTSGEIQTGTYTGIKDTRGRYAVELNEIGDDGHNKWRTTNPEDLTDEAQARFAEELAGKPLRDQVSEDTAPRELFTGEAHDVAEASAERNEVLSVGAIEELGHNALGASGIEAPAAEPTREEMLGKILDKAPVLRHFESELKQIAAVRKREDKEGYRHGMSQFDSSERMIDDLLKLAGQVEKPKTMSEDRRGAIYRYIDQI